MNTHTVFGNKNCVLSCHWLFPQIEDRFPQTKCGCINCTPEQIGMQRVMSQVLWNHFRGVMGFLWKESTFVVACLLKPALVNTIMIAGSREEGEYYERSKNTASRFVSCMIWFDLIYSLTSRQSATAVLGELLPIISIFWVSSQNPNTSQSERRVLRCFYRSICT